MTKLRLICVDEPPAEREGVATEFGLLVKGEIIKGSAIPDGLLFETDVSIEKKRDIKGLAVQGMPGQRFLYLAWRETTPDAGFIRRWKVRLDGVPRSGVAEARIRSAGGVWPEFIGGGWKSVD